MPLLQWLMRKPPEKAASSQPSSGLPLADATVPFKAGPVGRKSATNANANEAANRKSMRLERREQLYIVVRHAMVRAGVLSASYKFKVLSLDASGLQYLVMLDVARKSITAPERMAEIERVIAHQAKAQHGIQVTAVYWRIHEHVSAGGSEAKPTLATTPVVSQTPGIPRFDPLREDEVAAFKQALASASTPMPLSAPGEIIKSGRRNPSPEPTAEFEVDRRASPLSSTQYGELN
jgi:hypothetical protein